MNKANSSRIVAVIGVALACTALSVSAGGSGRFGPKDGLGVKTDVDVRRDFKEAASANTKPVTSNPVSQGKAGSDTAAKQGPRPPVFKPPF